MQLNFIVFQKKKIFEQKIFQIYISIKRKTNKKKKTRRSMKTFLKHINFVDLEKQNIEETKTKKKF